MIKKKINLSLILILFIIPFIFASSFTDCSYGNKKAKTKLFQEEMQGGQGTQSREEMNQ